MRSLIDAKNGKVICIYHDAPLWEDVQRDTAEWVDCRPSEVESLDLTATDEWQEGKIEHSEAVAIKGEIVAYITSDIEAAVNDRLTSERIAAE